MTKDKKDKIEKPSFMQEETKKKETINPINTKTPNNKNGNNKNLVLASIVGVVGLAGVSVAGYFGYTAFNEMTTKEEEEEFYQAETDEDEEEIILEEENDNDKEDEDDDDDNEDDEDEEEEEDEKKALDFEREDEDDLVAVKTDEGDFVFVDKDNPLLNKEVASKPKKEPKPKKKYDFKEIGSENELIVKKESDGTYTFLKPDGSKGNIAQLTRPRPTIPQTSVPVGKNDKNDKEDKEDKEDKNEGNLTEKPPVAVVPPTEKPPTVTPPTEKPPVAVVPPTEQPPTVTPPTEKPPVAVVPPTEKPPTVTPPTEKPPVTVVPPTEKPPTVTPPTEQPPTVTPPTEKPPTEKPSTEDKPTINDEPKREKSSVVLASTQYNEALRLLNLINHYREDLNLEPLKMSEELMYATYHKGNYYNKQGKIVSYVDSKGLAWSNAKISHALNVSIDGSIREVATKGTNSESIFSNWLTSTKELSNLRSDNVNKLGVSFVDGYVVAWFVNDVDDKRTSSSSKEEFNRINKSLNDLYQKNHYLEGSVETSKALREEAEKLLEKGNYNTALERLNEANSVLINKQMNIFYEDKNTFISYEDTKKKVALLTKQQEELNEEDFNSLRKEWELLVEMSQKPNVTKTEYEKQLLKVNQQANSIKSMPVMNDYTKTRDEIMSTISQNGKDSYHSASVTRLFDKIEKANRLVEQAKTDSEIKKAQEEIINSWNYVKNTRVDDKNKLTTDYEKIKHFETTPEIRDSFNEKYKELEDMLAKEEFNQTEYQEKMKELANLLEEVKKDQDEINKQLKEKEKEKENDKVDVSDEEDETTTDEMEDSDKEKIINKAESNDEEVIDDEKAVDDEEAIDDEEKIVNGTEHSDNEEEATNGDSSLENENPEPLHVLPTSVDLNDVENTEIPEIIDVEIETETNEREIQEVAPSVQEVTPPVQEVAPPVQEVTPPVQEVAPPVQEVAPQPVQEVAPSVQEVTPPVQEVAPQPVQEVVPQPVQVQIIEDTPLDVSIPEPIEVEVNY